MTQNLDRRVLSKLAKIDTNGMKHTQKLDAFAKALGHKSQTAMMTALKAKEPSQPKRLTESLDDILARLFETAFRSRKDGPQDPFPRSDWAYEVDCDYTSRGREDWWEDKLSQFLEDECGVDAQLDAIRNDRIPFENVSFALSGPHSIDHFDVDDILGDGYVALWDACVRDYAGLSDTQRAEFADEVGMMIRDAGAKKLSAYLSALAESARGNDAVGFSVRFHDPDLAERWVAEHRPEIWGDPVMAEVTLSTGDACEVDIRHMLVKADANVLFGLLEGLPDTDAIMKTGDDTIRNASHLVLYADALSQAQAWIRACRKDVVASLDAPSPQP